MSQITTRATFLGLALLLSGAAQAQAPVCGCDATATRTPNNAALASLLGNRMACAQVGSEQWQEWHNGTGSGPVVDYKLGPNHPLDPSKATGTYSVANNLVAYTYGSNTYTYEVCLPKNGTAYTFCGAAFGGRNITGVRIGGSGLQPCSGVVSVPMPSGGAVRR